MGYLTAKSSPTNTPEPTAKPTIDAPEASPANKSTSTKLTATDKLSSFDTSQALCSIKKMIFEKTELTEFLSKNKGIPWAIY